MVVCNFARWRGLGQRAKCAGGDGFELGHVESGVDAQQLGQLEVVTGRIADALQFHPHEQGRVGADNTREVSKGDW